MGSKHTKKEILEGALNAAMSDGLSQLTYGRLATHLGTSDRVIVYYFPTKDDLVTEVLLATGLHLQEALQRAFAGRAESHVELTRTAWPVLARQEVDPIFALYFEAVGLAVAGRQPYRSLVTQLIEEWVAWLSGFFDGPEEHCRSEAEAAIALIDGLLLLRQVAGSDAAGRAAGRLLFR